MSLPIHTESARATLLAKFRKVPGLHQGAIAILFDDTADPLSGLTILAELAVQRAGEADEINQKIRQITIEVAGRQPKVNLLRPDWFPRNAEGQPDPAQAAEKFSRARQTRQTVNRLLIGAHEENITEDHKDAFAGFGTQTRIRTPVDISLPSHIHLGSWVSLGRYGQIIMLNDFSAGPDFIRQHYPEIPFEPKSAVFSIREPRLTIRDGSSLGSFFFIACSHRVEIGRHVVTSQRLFITDCGHAFNDPRLPINLQGNTWSTPVIIEDGCWIGINVSIVRGVTIGRHAIIGAGSVVTSDIPPYAIAAGAPARVIRMQDPQEIPDTCRRESLTADEIVLLLFNYLENLIGDLTVRDFDLPLHQLDAVSLGDLIRYASTRFSVDLSKKDAAKMTIRQLAETIRNAEEIP